MSDIPVDYAISKSKPEDVNVLLIGGGDGRICKYVLNKGVGHMVTIELDKQVADVCKLFFPDDGMWEVEGKSVWL